MKSLILAGGSGARLWPLSRANFPKQFLKLKNNKKSLFQMTFERSLQLSQDTDIFIVTNESCKFLVVEQVEELGYKLNMKQVLVEPMGKNTLPAVCYGLKEIVRNGDCLVAVFPSTQISEYNDIVANIIKNASDLTKDNLITFGNSGILLFRTDLFREELRSYCPEVYQAFELDSIEECYQRSPGISVDDSLIDKSNKVTVVPMDIKRTELTNFDALFEEYAADEQGNIKFNGDILLDSSNNLLYKTKDKTMALVDVNDLIVVDDQDALLICKKGQSQKVQELVEQLKAKADPRLDSYITVHRPWGSYTVLEEGKFYKIKRITVLPGKELSYQMHHHRSEHWVVVKGTAIVIIDDQENLIRSGEGIFIKSGFKHRLKNPGKIPLEVIEVQIGEYLEEDDIIRFADNYGRVFV